ncbi:hypothetical protein BD779DRAFT_1677714 [Infundibulicybe gibba]|nr:hypothetical protein BD779DRAFT_1677714 [Infundibulicybe gibba]
MSDLVNGVFLITPHNGKPTGIDDARITRNGPMMPLTLDGPGADERQGWLVRKVEGPRELYTLTRLGGPPEGFFWEGDIPKPHSPVLLGEPKHLTLNKIEGGPTPIYQIQPGTIIVGAAYYVGYDGNRVQFVDYIVDAHPPPHEIPAWKFTPIN